MHFVILTFLILAAKVMLCAESEKVSCGKVVYALVGNRMKRVPYTIMKVVPTSSTNAQVFRGMADLKCSSKQEARFCAKERDFHEAVGSQYDSHERHTIRDRQEARHAHGSMQGKAYLDERDRISEGKTWYL